MTLKATVNKRVLRYTFAGKFFIPHYYEMKLMLFNQTFSIGLR